MHSGKYRCFIKRLGSFFPNSKNFMSSNSRRHSSAVRFRCDSFTRFRGLTTVQFGQNLHQVTPLSSLSFGRARMFSSGTQSIVPVMSKYSRSWVSCDWFPVQLLILFRLKFLWKKEEFFSLDFALVLLIDRNMKTIEVSSQETCEWWKCTCRFYMPSHYWFSLHFQCTWLAKGLDWKHHWSCEEHVARQYVWSYPQTESIQKTIEPLKIINIDWGTLG